MTKSLRKAIMARSWLKNRFNKTAYQPYVSATEFLHNKRLHTFLKTFFSLEANQNQYVKLQPNNKEVNQRWRQQQPLACNTPNSKGYR